MNRKRREIFSLVLLLYGIFITPLLIRQGLWGNSFFNEYVNYHINILSALGIMGLAFSIRWKETKNIVCAISIAILSILFYITQKNAWSIAGEAYFCCIFPLLLMMVKMQEDSAEQYIRIIANIYNCVIVLVLVCALIDYFSDRWLLRQLSAWVGENAMLKYYTFGELSDNRRMTSIYGFPLSNGVLFTTFYAVNAMLKKYLKKGMPMIVVTIMAIIGVAMTQSKTSLVVLLCLILCTNITNIKMMVVSAVVVLTGFYTGIFDNLLNRFTSYTLTTGRNEVLQKVLSDGKYPFQFLKGYGFLSVYEYNMEVPGVKAAFEYPLLMFSLDFGILFGIIIILLILLYPTYVLWKHKHYFMMVCLWGLFLQVNTFNGISLNCDQMLFYCFTVFLILNLSYCIKEKQIEEADANADRESCK